ncbi:hypothetical protein LTR56_001996 [Elasticomyces elasticus]|nr:hypothetical protein LTR22_011581 [Elasticomyces elasticus]KAK3658140.1 hypothetical protein LTR56_001996 [Elasticomyces elasticus]KAK4906030.1 hypothetical protein LTR49_024761 [Elasticomyces elasticus]KAK5764025.1 hypothetical protein LTS12_005718 [Elasticomyces elasticus]
MAPTRGAGRLMALAAIAGSALQANAQTETTSTPVTITSASGSTASPSTTDIPLALWSQANSLLSSYYPSTTLTQVASLTWPSSVVLGSSTYSVPPKSTSTPATSVLAEATNTSKPTHGLRSDEKLGIGIGVAVGAVALIVLGIVFCLMQKRRKATGALFKRRPTPSVTDSDVENWRSPMSRQASTLSYGPSREWMQQYNRMSDAPAGPAVPPGHNLQPPPMAMHPAFVRQYSSRSTSEDNPFFTPNETPSPDHDESSGAVSAASYRVINNDTPSHDSSISQQYDTHRPTSPIAPVMMTTSWAQRMHDTPSHESSTSQQNDMHRSTSPIVPAMMTTSWAQRMHGEQPQQPQHNPFASPEDDEHDDVISPIIPIRSPERRHSPMVHYPSWTEVSEFDFAGERGSSGRPSRQSLRGQQSGEDGEDGWRPTRGESVYGRQELA